MTRNWLSRVCRLAAVPSERGGKSRARKKSKSVRLSVEKLEDRTTPSVTLGVSVDGMNTSNNFGNVQPPDTIAAAGPNHVVEMVNLGIEVFDKSGNVTSAPQSLLTFFSNHKNGNQSDPFVFYDEIGGKFVAGVLDYSNTNKGDYVDFATGVDSPSGITWTLHAPYASGEGRKFLDYPRVGYNADAYFIEGNMFQGSFKNVQVITIDKSTLKVDSRHDDSSLFTLTPAAMHGATPGGPEYFVESANGGGSSLAVVTETNVTSSSPTFTTSSVSVPAYSSGGSPSQPGGTVPSFDDRIFDAAFRTTSDGVSHLVAAHQVAGSSVPVVARWYDINAGTMSLIQSGDAPAGTSGSSQFMPSVNINTAGSIGMTFDESSSSEYWSMYVTERTASDTPGTMEAPVLAQAGTAKSPDSRVGDFSSTSVDPTDGLTFWSANEYQGADFWDTHIASFSIAGAIAQPLNTVTLSNPRVPQAVGTPALPSASLAIAQPLIPAAFPNPGAPQAGTTTTTSSASVADEAVPNQPIGSYAPSIAAFGAHLRRSQKLDWLWSNLAPSDL